MILVHKMYAAIFVEFVEHIHIATTTWLVYWHFSCVGHIIIHHICRVRFPTQSMCIRVYVKLVGLSCLWGVLYMEASLDLFGLYFLTTFLIMNHLRIKLCRAIMTLIVFFGHYDFVVFITTRHLFFSIYLFYQYIFILF